MDLQRDFEEDAHLRVKFAVHDESDVRLVGLASAEYVGLLLDDDGMPAAWLPSTWLVEPPIYIETISEHRREAWLLTTSDGAIAAVEHETGLEIIVAWSIAIGTPAFVGLVKKAWSEWGKRRKAGEQKDWDGRPVKDTLIIDHTQERSADGSRTRTRLEIPAAFVTDDILERVLSDALDR